MSTNINFPSIIPIGKAIIDSFSLKIEMSKIDVLDAKLTSMTSIVYQDTGEFEENLPPKPVVISENGITIRFSLCSFPVYDKETGERPLTQFLVLTVSSKLLKERYFEGINKFNISHLFKTFLEFNVFSCTIQSFLNGQISDIDICVNNHATKPIFSEVCKSLLIMAGLSSQRMRLFDDEKQIGLMFSNRGWGTPSYPFIKAYHKELELKTKSKEFYDNYLQPYEEQMKNLVRMEGTIRNYKHKLRLEKFDVLPKFKTLGDFLEIPEKNLHSFLNFSLNSYVNKTRTLPTPQLSPTDHLLYNLIQMCIDKGYDKIDILAVCDTFKGANVESDKVAKSRLKNKVKKLIDLLVDKDRKIKEKLQTNQAVKVYLNEFGIMI
jgi:hypothetical protein